MIFCFRYKTNEIVNKFLLAGDKFMPEMHLKQLGFTYSSCGPFTNKKERIENTEYSYKNDLDKACFNVIWLMVNLNNTI